MRKVILLLLVSLFFSCQSNKVVIEGDMKTMPDGTELRLMLNDIELGKTTSKGGKFNFTYELTDIKTPAIGYITMPGGGLSLIIEAGTIKVESQDRAWPTPYGTKYNDILAEWHNDDYKKMIEGKGEREISSIRYNARKTFYYSIFNDGTDSYARLFALYYAGGYGDNEVPTLDKLEKELGQRAEIDYIRKNIEIAKQMAAQRNAVNTGSQFKELIAKDVEGKEFKLSEAVKNNNLTLLEFWASWCKPCVEEIPHLESAYKKYKSEGFEIYAYSIDKRRDDWVKADKNYDFKWISVSGDNKDAIDEILTLYAVTSVPTNYVIDSKGVIIAKDVRGDDLEFMLENILK